MSRYNEVGKHATKVIRTDLGIGCLYHDTVVALKQANIVTLNSGGWRTNTTKLRMNQFAQQYCNGRYCVYQQRGEWYVTIYGKGEPGERENRVIDFEDNMQFDIGGIA